MLALKSDSFRMGGLENKGVLQGERVLQIHCAVEGENKGVNRA